MATNFHLYQKERSANYNYIDRVIKSYFESGGGVFHIYPLIGTRNSDGSVNPLTEQMISDPILNENSRRAYSKSAFELWGVTKMSIPQLNFTFAGYTALDTDTKDLWLHYNSMIETLGRKIISGDVIEVTWIRSSNLDETKFYSKFYQVIDSQRDDDSWSPMYHYHIWKLKIKPVTDSTEFADLFNTDDSFYEDLNSFNGGGGMDPSNTETANLLEQDEQIEHEAAGEDEDGNWIKGGVNYRLHNEHHAYMEKCEDPWEHKILVIQGIDGITAELNCADIPYGVEFPDNPQKGDYFLRIDYENPRLYRREGLENGICYWQMYEVDWRNKWMGVPEPLRRVINNEETITVGNETQNMRQNIKDLIPARVLKEDKKLRPWNKEMAEKIGTEDIIGIEKSTTRPSCKYTIIPTPIDAVVTLTTEGYKQRGNYIKVHKNTNVEWSVSAEGYETQSGSFTIVDDKTDYIILKK